MDRFMDFFSALGRFLFGTMRRAQGTAVAALLVLAYNRPDVIEKSISRLAGAVLGAINPMIVPLLTLLFIFWGYRIMWRGIRGKPAPKGK
ncbi:hypothetical protein BH11PAT3_BH11PAT3_1260 [soil metagenome]